jgi:magnesium transporter
MPRFVRKSIKRAGSSPGTLVHVGDTKAHTIRISMLQYDAETLMESDLNRFEEAPPHINPARTTWINIDGIHDIALIEEIGRQLDIHPLTLEDVLNTTQRPKAEAFDKYLYVAMKMLRYDNRENLITSEQISLILGNNVLIGFQEAVSDVFSPVRERIRKGKGRIRTSGCDYLAYALIDAIVDNYFAILERLGERLEEVEENLDDHPGTEVLETIHTIRGDLIYLRKQVWPLREVISHLQKDGAPFISEATALFMRDVYDHTIQTIDTIESYRDILSGIQDLYLSIISNRMNEIMKVLTIIATIFIPVSFIAGIYGMNFTHMPELSWRWGYPAVWGVIITAIGGMLLWFRHKKWF